MVSKPKMSNSASEKQIEEAAKQFDQYDANIKEMTLDRMNEAPKKEMEPQTKLSSRDLENSKEIYLKPTKTISVPDKFNEKFRDKWNFAKEYVRFIAENNEIIGESLEIWTKPFAGVPCEFWTVPVNKPLWGPRYLAEQIKKCSYHRLTMQQNTIVESNGIGQIYGALVVDSTIQRLDARPATQTKSIFMGAANF